MKELKVPLGQSCLCFHCICGTVKCKQISLITEKNDSAVSDFFQFSHTRKQQHRVVFQVRFLSSYNGSRGKH